MNKYYAIALSLVIFAACSNPDNDNAVTYDVTAEQVPPSRQSDASAKKPAMIKSRITDENADVSSAPYQMGRRHAEKLHRSTSQEQICDELLDINARVTNISSRISPEAANDYLCGIRDYLTEQHDTLATTLF